MARPESAASKTGTLLEVDEITKSYGPVEVLKGVSFSMAPGEVVGFVGHNGAGKSTLLKIMSGAHAASGGTLKVKGDEVQFSSPRESIEAGVSTVYQELSLLPNLTVVQNVWLGRELSGPTGLDIKAMRRGAQELVDTFGIDVDVDRKVGSYPVATRQLLEIAIAASKDTSCLLLDEPTTALEGEQISELMQYLRGLADKRGIGILLVNHKLDELYEVADRIVALMDGRIILDEDVATVDRNQVIAAIAGEEAAAALKVRQEVQLPPATPYFAVEDMRNKMLKGVSFKASKGRVLGIYGLGGSGRSETLRAIAGIDSVYSGTVTVGETTFSPTNPANSMKHGIAFLTEERKQDGIVPLMNSVMNAGLPILSRFSTWSVLDKSKLGKYVGTLLSFLKLHGDPNAPITSLSGGNQQKVLLARVLGQDPNVLLLDEPTKGVDIGVKTEIHQVLRDLAHTEDLVVIMVSSEEEEILDVSDEVIVFGGGTVTAGPIPVADLSISALRELAWGTDT